MNLILWLMQYWLLSLAIFVLLGEELDFDHTHGGLLCERVITVAGEATQQYPYISRCSKLEKCSKWQILFGLLTAGQTTFLLAMFGFRRHRKSAGLLLPVVFVTFWVLTVILLLTKVAAHFSPEPQTAANTGHTGALFTPGWIALTTVLAVVFRKIFHVVGNLTANADKLEDLRNGVYFCLPAEDEVLREGVSGNIPCALVALTVAYFITSCYTICLVLAHGEVEQSEGNKRLQRCQKRGDYENDSLDLGGEDQVYRKKTTDLEVTLASPSCCRDVNKNTVTVGSGEESEDESFVFGWRL